MVEHVNINAFVCCDKVIREAETGKQTVVGIFQNFNFGKLPARFSAPWFIYAQLNSLDPGGHTVTVNIAHDDTNSVVYAATVEIDEDHPENVNIVLNGQPTEFTKAGEYDVTLNIDGLQQAHYLLTVNQKRQSIGGV